MPISANFGTPGSEPQETSERSGRAPVPNGSGRKAHNPKLKEIYSARMSELLISATSVEHGPVDETGPGPPHRPFIVHVRIQNVSKRFPCTSLTASL